MHSSTMLPALIDALQEEAVAIASTMKELTLSQALMAKGRKQALCPNLAAALLVMRIVSTNEALTELRGAVNSGSPVVLPASPRRRAESAPDRYPLAGGVASDALRELADRQQAVERRYDWLCQMLGGEPQLSRVQA